MDDITQLAERILLKAAQSEDGCCQAKEIITGKNSLDQALKVLAVYGTTNLRAQGVHPIFEINDIGRLFASQGAWTKQEEKEKEEEKRYNESVGLAKKGNRLVKWSIAVTVITGLVTLITTLLTK